MNDSIYVIEKAKEIARNYREVRKDYDLDCDVFSEDPLRLRLAKQAVKELPLAEQTLLILYADLQSYRGLGAVLGVSHFSARKRVMAIAEKVRERVAQLALSMPTETRLDKLK